jgi:hypothetical protein
MERGGHGTHTNFAALELVHHFLGLPDASSPLSPTRQPSVSGEARTAGTMLFAQIGYDNLPFGDVLARSEYGMSLLDAISELLRTAAIAEDEYAKRLLDSAACCAPGRIKGTGQGIGATVDGAAQRQAGGLMGASLSAMGLGGLWGSGGGSSASSGAASNASNDSMTMGSGHGVGNGLATLSVAIDQLCRSQAKAAQQRQAVANHFRRIHASLQAMRTAQHAASTTAIAKATDAVRATQGIGKELERSHARVDKTRRDLADAESRYLSARDSGAGVPEAEMNRRMRTWATAKQEFETAEQQVMQLTENLVASRRRRDDELTVVARQLQRLDEERMTALSRVLSDISGTHLETAGVTRSLAATLADAVSDVCVEGDMRMFVHQRRIALMLGEQTALADVRAGRPPTGPGAGSRGLADDDAGTLTVPRPVPMAVTMRHSREFIETERQLAPIVKRWVEALLTGTGSEMLQGRIVARIDAPSKSSEDNDSSVEAESGSGGEVFDIAVLDAHPARIAMLRALNQQRSKSQDISPCFFRMARVLWWLLDACEAHQDICCARMVMVMAETFFHFESSSSSKGADASADGESGSGAAAEAASGKGEREKVFLQRYLKLHSIWKADAFWEECFYTSVHDAVRAASSIYGGGSKLSPLSSSDDDSGSGGGGGSSEPTSPTASPALLVRPGTTDWNYSYQQTLFSQLAAVAMNMITFGAYGVRCTIALPPSPPFSLVIAAHHFFGSVFSSFAGMPPERVQRSVASIARGNGLNNEMAAALQSTVSMYAARD